MTRDDLRWGVATVLAAILCLYTLPFLPLAWLAGRSGR